MEQRLGPEYYAGEPPPEEEWVVEARRQHARTRHEAISRFLRDQGLVARLREAGFELEALQAMAMVMLDYNDEKYRDATGEWPHKG